jgi:hypothetical protein
VLERTFLGLMLHHEEHGERLIERFGPADLEHPLARRIVEKACAIVSEGRPVTASALLEAFAGDEPARELLGELAVAEEYGIGAERTAEDLALRLERRALERQRARVDTEIRKAKARGDEERLTELVREKTDLARSLAALVPASPQY